MKDHRHAGTQYPEYPAGQARTCPMCESVDSLGWLEWYGSMIAVWRPSVRETRTSAKGADSPGYQQGNAETKEEKE